MATTTKKKTADPNKKPAISYWSKDKLICSLEYANGNMSTKKQTDR